MLKNHWNVHRQKICDKFLKVTQKHQADVTMGEWERLIFEEEQLTFHTVLAQVTVDVEAAFVANNGTLRAAVSKAIEELQEALDVFERSL